MRTLRWPALAGALVTALLALVGCGKDGDTGGVTCTALCYGTLTLSAADGSSQFLLDFSGGAFDGFSVSCPGDATAGGLDLDVDIECVDGGLELQYYGAPYPDDLAVDVTLNSASTGAQAISPEWESVDLCGSTCTSGAATFQLP